jgi:Protein of unknown function (DUF2591)
MSSIKHKVSELEGAQLDAAVALCEGWTFKDKFWRHQAGVSGQLMQSPPSFSTWWGYGGPIIERERITHYHCGLEHWDEPWFAGKNLVPQSEGSTEDSGFHVTLWMDHQQTGPSPLIAAMRAYVASKFGDVVDLP